MNWPDTAHCASRAHCPACLLNTDFRASIVRTYPEWDGKCPHGVTLESLPLPAARTVSYKLNPDGTRCATCRPVGGGTATVTV